MYNKIIVVGNLGSDVTEKTTTSGTQMASFSMAANRKWKDQEETTWFRVTVFGRQAETCLEYLRKGSLVLVEGRLRPDEDGNPRIWERSDGTPAASFEITADNVRFLGGKTNASGGYEDKDYATSHGQPGDEYGEIPF